MISAHEIKLQSMTTYVRVMYVLDKHVHAPNLFVINIFTGVFYPHVRVWRLILKKSSLVVFYTITVGPFQVRCKSVPNPIQLPFTNRR